MPLQLSTVVFQAFQPTFAIANLLPISLDRPSQLAVLSLTRTHIKIVATHSHNEYDL